jgi:hypothetical protein
MLVVEGGERVYVEIISPELSQAMQNAEEGVGILACALTACTPGLITDVHLIGDPDEGAVRQVLAFVLSAPKAAIAHEIPGVAFVTIRPFDPRIELINQISSIVEFRP